MRAPKIALAAAAAALVFAGCRLDVGGFEGKTCTTANDCPDDLVCVPSPSGIESTCEALALPPTVPIEPVDAGFADYCTDVKPILDANCLACHAVPPAGGAPGTLRLDTYDTVGGIPGAQAEAQRIYTRTVVTKDMPPGTPLSPKDQATITAWFQSGAPFCADGGTATDGGTADAGM